MRIAKTYNWIVFGYLSLVTLLTFNGNIAYGHGLGDLVYFILSGILALTQLTVTLVIYHKQKRQLNWTAFYLCGTLFLLAAIFLTWKFTLGRGGEYSWNGNIFF